MYIYIYIERERDNTWNNRITVEIKLLMIMIIIISKRACNILWMVYVSVESRTGLTYDTNTKSFGPSRRGARLCLFVAITNNTRQQRQTNTTNKHKEQTQTNTTNRGPQRRPPGTGRSTMTKRRARWASWSSARPWDNRRGSEREGDTGVCERSNPPGRKSLGKTSLKDTKSWAGEEFMLLFSRAEAHIKGIVVSTDTSKIRDLRLVAPIAQLAADVYLNADINTPQYLCKLFSFVKLHW